MPLTCNADVHLLGLTSSLLSHLAGVPNPAVYATVVRQALPALCGAIGSPEDAVAAAALEQLGGLLEGAPAEGGVGEGFVAQLGPVLFEKLRTTQDRNAIQVRRSSRFGLRGRG